MLRALVRADTFQMELRVNRRQLLARKREGKSERTVCRALILRFIICLTTNGRISILPAPSILLQSDRPYPLCTRRETVGAVTPDQQRTPSVREGLEHLISAGRTGTVLSREECELVQFYLSEILTILKDL
jgi:hypothetical protein